MRDDGDDDDDPDLPSGMGNTDKAEYLRQRAGYIAMLRGIEPGNHSIRIASQSPPANGRKEASFGKNSLLGR